MFGDSNKKSKFKRVSSLVAMTVIFYVLYYLVFHNFKEIYSNMIQMVVQAPFDMLVTGCLFNYILNRKEEKEEEKKLNMLIDIFYSEIGNDILDIMVKSDGCIDEVREFTLIKRDWEEEEFEILFEKLDNFKYCADVDKVDLEKLKLKLEEATPLILDLLTNPSIQKNDEFNEIILSIFHLKSELDDRYDEINMEEYEKEHIKKDMDNMYRLVAKKWVVYMYHLKEFCPPLFVKALIKSPFDNRDYKIKDKDILINKK